KGDRSLEFDSVIVCELLGPRDRRSGLSLFEHTIQPRGPTHDIFTADVPVPSTDHLVPALWQVFEESRRRDLSPIIHIETHGSKRGLGLDPDHAVLWSALVPPLRAINELAKMSL